MENSRVVLLDLQSYPQWFSQRFFQGFIRVFPLINKFTLPTTVKTNIVLKAVPSKTTMPILECILIDASTDEIKLTANDMELGIETKVEGDIL